MKKIINDDEIASPDRLLVLKVARRYPGRAQFRRFLQTVKKTGAYYDHDTESREITVVFEDAESREAGKRLLLGSLRLNDTDVKEGGG